MDICCHILNKIKDFYIFPFFSCTVKIPTKIIQIFPFLLQKSLSKWLAENNTEVLQWSELNPVENAWYIMKKKRWNPATFHP